MSLQQRRYPLSREEKDRKAQLHLQLRQRSRFLKKVYKAKEWLAKGASICAEANKKYAAFTDPIKANEPAQPPTASLWNRLTTGSSSSSEEESSPSH